MQIKITSIPSHVKAQVAVHYKRIKIKALPWDLEKPVSVAFATELLYKMIKTCMLSTGVGLAAPQIGVQKALIVIRDFVPVVGDTLNLEGSFTGYFNPTWTAVPKDGKEAQVEGCLSVPGQSYAVDRWKTIQAKWYELVEDGVFMEREEIFTGIKARVWQHECDHLNAKSIVDKGLLLKPGAVPVTKTTVTK